MGSPNIDGMIQQAARAIQDGNRADAQQLLMRAVELDQYNEAAWLYLASAVDTEEEKRTCLENVLVINPDHAEAQRQLAALDGTPEPAPDVSFTDDTSSEADFDNFVEDVVGTEETATPAAFDDAFSGGFMDDDIADGPFSTDVFDDSAFDAPPPTSNPIDEFFETEIADSPPPPIEDEAPPESLADLGVFADEEPGTNKGALMGDFDYIDEDTYDDDADPLELIPANIKPTRLPGSDETASRGLVFGVGILAVLNVIAVIFIVLQLL